MVVGIRKEQGREKEGRETIIVCASRGFSGGETRSRPSGWGGRQLGGILHIYHNLYDVGNVKG